MITFKEVTKAFNGTVFIKGLNLQIRDGEIVVLIGGSGCGKTTTLKMINKLVQPTSGQIFIDDKDIETLDAIELRRSIGYVIQQTGLFPHMTVGTNIGIVPSLQKWPKDKISARTLELLSMVGMEPNEFLKRYPNELSGGQKQRVGVARAFATSPQIILMDEPFSALDPITRAQLQDVLCGLQKQFRKTIVFVTHDMSEALKLGDRICIMKSGEIIQYDTPENILKSPAHGYVEEFLGKSRIWDKPEFITARDILIESRTSLGDVPASQAGYLLQDEEDVLLVVDAAGRYEGAVTQAAMHRAEKETPLSQLIDRQRPVIREDETILQIVEMVQSHAFLPVVTEAGRPVGVVTRKSLIAILSGQLQRPSEGRTSAGGPPA